VRRIHISQPGRSALPEAMCVGVPDRFLDLLPGIVTMVAVSLAICATYWLLQRQERRFQTVVDKAYRPKDVDNH